MKYTILDFNNNEYKLFESYLNNLSINGYCIDKIDYIAKKNPSKRNYKYKVELYIRQNIGLTKKQQVNAIIEQNEANGYEYCGRIRKMFVFRSKKNIIEDDEPFVSPESIKNYKTKQTTSKIILTLIMAFIVYMVASITFSNNTIDQNLTTGSIILHYSLLILSLVLLYRCTYKLVIDIKLKKDSLTISFYKLLSNIFKGIVLVFCIIVLSGFSLDVFQRQTIAVSGSNENIITLESLGHRGSSQNKTYVEMHSLSIDKTIAYLETNDDDDTIYSRSYTFNNKDKCDYFIKEYLEDDNYEQVNKVGENNYLLKDQYGWTTLINKKDKEFTYVTTSFSLENNYQNIIEQLK